MQYVIDTLCLKKTMPSPARAPSKVSVSGVCFGGLLAAGPPDAGSTSKIPSSSSDLLHTGQQALTANHFLRATQARCAGYLFGNYETLFNKSKLHLIHDSYP